MKKQVKFVLGEIIIIIASLYIGIYLFLPFTLQLFSFTSQGTFDFLTPGIIGSAIAFFIPISIGTIIWYKIVFGKNIKLM